jgi:chromosomal replication initiator protein
MTPLPTVFEIQRIVSRASRVRVSSLRAPFGCVRNGRRIARARQLSMCLAARLTDHSLNRIGHFHGRRDHSTVVHACRVVERRCRRDARLRNRMRRLTLELIRR